jgi:hypothetical protein
MIKSAWESLGTETLWRETLLLRIAVAACFIGHGLIAIQVSSNFGSEWSYWIRSVLPSAIEYNVSKNLLRLIGVIDIVDGVCLLLPRIPKQALAWVLGWGFLTALSRLFFLGAHIPPFELNGFHAFAEFLKRTPNWILPLLLVATTSPGMRFSASILKNRYKILTLTVAAQVAAIFLNNAYEYQGAYFDFELVKLGMPTWYFWSVTGLSGLAILMLPAVYFFGERLRLIRAGALSVLVVYLMAEGFSIFARNAPGGFSYALIRFISHLSMYTCLFWWVSWSLQRPKTKKIMS